MISLQAHSWDSKSYTSGQLQLTPVQTPPAPAPTHEQIALCAYDIYLEHGRTEGRSQLDWRQAEEELAQTPRASWPKSPTHTRD